MCSWVLEVGKTHTVTLVRFWVYLRGLLWSVDSKGRGGCFPHTSFSSKFKFRVLGWPSCIQLDSFRQEGRGATENTGANSLISTNASASSSAKAPLDLCRKPKFWNVVISTMGALFSGAKSLLDWKSTHRVRGGSWPRVPNNLTLPFVTQIQKSLVLKTTHLLRSNRAPSISKYSCYYNTSRPELDKIWRSKKNDIN